MNEFYNKKSEEQISELDHSLRRIIYSDIVRNVYRRREDNNHLEKDCDRLAKDLALPELRRKDNDRTSVER